MANFLQGIGDLFTGGGAQAGATAVQRDLAARQAAGQAAYGQAYNTGSAAINAGAEKATAAYAPLSALGTKYGAGSSSAIGCLGRKRPGGRGKRPSKPSSAQCLISPRSISATRPSTDVAQPAACSTVATPTGMRSCSASKRRRAYTFPGAATR